MTRRPYRCQSDLYTKLLYDQRFRGDHDPGSSLSLTFLISTSAAAGDLAKKDGKGRQKLCNLDMISH
jgi:hypothetical protein